MEGVILSACLPTQNTLVDLKLRVYGRVKIRRISVWAE